MNTTDLQTLPSRFFQPALSTRVVDNPAGYYSDRLGELVTDIADIEQCMRIILTTPKGSDPHRPLFGSDLHLYVDYPIDAARPHIVRETVEAIRSWEPRVEVLKVNVSLLDLAQLDCQVEWQLSGALSAQVRISNLVLGVAQ